MNLGRLKNILCIWTMVLVSGLPTTLAQSMDRAPEEPGKRVLSSQGVATIVDLKARAKTYLPTPFLKLEAALSAGRNLDMPSPDLEAAAVESAGALRRFKSELESAAAALVPELVAGSGLDVAQALAPFYVVVVDYYRLKGYLHTALETLRGRSSRLSAAALNELELVFPCEAALGVSAHLSANREATQQSFDIPIMLSDVGSDKGAGRCQKRLSLSAYEAMRYATKSFLLHPDESTLARPIVFQAVKLNLGRQAMLNGYLFSDEKEMQQLPAGIDPIFQQQEAYALALAREATFRTNAFSPPPIAAFESPLKTLSDLMGRFRKGYREKVRDYFQSVLRKFVRNLDPALMAQSFALSAKDQDELKAAIAGARTSWMQAFLAKNPKFVDSIVERFIEVEAQYRMDNLKERLQAMPIYLTQLPTEELRKYLDEAERSQLVTFLMDGALSNFMINFENVGEEDLGQIIAETRAAAEEMTGTRNLPDSHIQDFVRLDRDSDYYISFQRYQLAGQVIEATAALEDTTKKLEKVQAIEASRSQLLDKLRGTTKLPLSPLIPANPDVAVGLQAVKFEGERPEWMAEMVRHIGARVSKAKDGEGLKMLRTLAYRFPFEVLRAARKARNSSAHAGTIDLIRAKHEELLGTRGYRWQSQEMRLTTLQESLGDKPQAVLALDGFRSLWELSERAPGLRDRATSMLEELVGGEFRFKPMTQMRFGKFSELDTLIDEAETAVKWIKANKQVLASVFAPEGRRISFLREQLRDGSALLAYYSNLLQSLHVQFPFLSAQVQISKAGRAETGFDEPLRLSELVIRVREAAKRSSIDVPLIRHFLPALKRQATRELINQPVPAPEGKAEARPINPELLVIGGVKGMKEDWTLWRKFMDHLMDWRSENGNHNPPTEDSHWPRTIKVRDMLPALNDDADAQTKALRIVVSALLSPYLRSAAIASRHEAYVLLNGKDNTKVLMASEAYRMLMAEGPDAIASGLTAAEKKAYKWRRYWDNVKSVTHISQKYNGYAFYGQLYGEFSVVDNQALGYMMLASAVPDLFTDIMMFADYWSSYWQMRPFALGGSFGKGLFYPSDLEQLKEQIYMQGEVLYDRVPLDLMFFYSGFHGIGMKLKAVRAGKQADLISLAGVNRREFTEEYAKLAEEFQEGGLNPNIIYDWNWFNQVYARKTAELRSKSKETDAAYIARADLIELRRGMIEFRKKYGPQLDKAMLLMQAKAEAEQIKARDQRSKLKELNDRLRAEDEAANQAAKELDPDAADKTDAPDKDGK